MRQQPEPLGDWLEGLPEPAVSASLGSLIKMQDLSFPLRPTESKSALKRGLRTMLMYASLRSAVLKAEGGAGPERPLHGMGKEAGEGGQQC